MLMRDKLQPDEDPDSSGSPDKLEPFDITGFSDSSENDEKWCFPTFYERIKIQHLKLTIGW
jgi:hypothetical protein